MVGLEAARRVIWGLIGLVEGHHLSAFLPLRLSVVILEVPHRAVTSKECQKNRQCDEDLATVVSLI